MPLVYSGNHVLLPSAYGYTEVIDDSVHEGDYELWAALTIIDVHSFWLSAFELEPARSSRPTNNCKAKGV